ncbi:hypothetical protein XSR1_160040 [Xenorhabdus szentirmaii DSM 16338]|uniref:Uncharacterized protein n=1 Tax=Xenorhabdus szentirmaii DSM 16338 TaxID=1427518 RepID=W1IX80_9GAMM|nr:hypothetical protein XSR1_160040 [Xenorhabdus szentirmaii DSM 16338]
MIDMGFLASSKRRIYPQTDSRQYKESVFYKLSPDINVY